MARTDNKTTWNARLSLKFIAYEILFFIVFPYCKFNYCQKIFGWFKFMSLTSLTVRTLDNVPLATGLGWKEVLFLRIIEKMHGVVR